VEIPHFVVKIEYPLKKINICHRKKLPVAGRNLLSQQEISIQGKKLPVTGRIFLSQEETSCHSKKPPMTERNFLSYEEAFKDERNAEEERWRLLKMFLCFKMVTKSLKIL
jgi:hypothetical protein